MRARNLLSRVDGLGHSRQEHRSCLTPIHLHRRPLQFSPSCKLRSPGYPVQKQDRRSNPRSFNAFIISRIPSPPLQPSSLVRAIFHSIFDEERPCPKLMGLHL
jgi:hypothetical protein